MNQQEKDLVIRDLQRELNEAKSAPQPLEVTLWLAQYAADSVQCGCDTPPLLAIEKHAKGYTLHYKCPECKTTRDVSYAPPPPAPNTVHERLEPDGFEGYNDGYCGPFKWHVRGTVAWFDCPCDACEKARGE